MLQRDQPVEYETEDDVPDMLTSPTAAEALVRLSNSMPDHKPTPVLSGLSSPGQILLQKGG